MKYYFKVWLFTLTVAPLIAVFIMWILSDRELSAIGPLFFMWSLSVIFGMGLSLPAFFLFKYLYNDIYDRGTSVWMKKCVFAVVGAGLVWVTFLILGMSIGESAGWEAMVFPATYSGSVVLASFLFNINNTENQWL